MMKRKLGNTEIEDINAALIVCGGFSIVCIGYLSYLVTLSDYSLLPYLTIPLLCGLVLENRRLEIDNKMLWLKLMLAVIFASAGILYLSLTSVNIITLLKNWPYFFIFFFALVSAIYHDKKVTPKITEGVTLLQSISLLYLIIDFKYFAFSNVAEGFVFVIAIVFTTFSFFNAFSYHTLTNNTRLILSIWSSIVMIVFSLVYIYRVYYFNHFTGNHFFDSSINFLQYFFLGISLIYMIQNGRMLAVFIPSKNSFFDEDHLNRIKKMNKLHVWRFSKEQVKIQDSLFILLLTVLVYSINYIFQFLPGFTLIWFVFWSAPIIIFVRNRVANKHHQKIYKSNV